MACAATPYGFGWRAGSALMGARGDRRDSARRHGARSDAGITSGCAACRSPTPSATRRTAPRLRSRTDGTICAAVRDRRRSWRALRIGRRGGRRSVRRCGAAGGKFRLRRYPHPALLGGPRVARTALVMLIPGIGACADATHREIEALVAGCENGAVSCPSSKGRQPRCRRCRIPVMSGRARSVVLSGLFSDLSGHRRRLP